MSQSLLYHAFGIREGYEYMSTSYEGGRARFVLGVKPEWLICPDCGSASVVRKGRRLRELQTVPIGLMPVFLVAEAPQCQRKMCGHRFEVSPPLPRHMSHTQINSKPSLAISTR
jgi:transposase